MARISAKQRCIILLHISSRHDMSLFKNHVKINHCGETGSCITETLILKTSLNASVKIHSKNGSFTPYSGYRNSVQSLSHARLCDPMDCSTSGLPVPHAQHLPEFAQVGLQGARGSKTSVPPSDSPDLQGLETAASPPRPAPPPPCPP